MSDETKVKEESKKKGGGLFKGMKSEFNKIVWPDREAVVKKTTAVVIVTIILGIIIALVDGALRFGMDKILTLG
jgi:preprotein translocase subunit SecE